MQRHDFDGESGRVPIAFNGRGRRGVLLTMSERITLLQPVPAHIPLAEREDDALMTLAAAGSMGAFETLVARHLSAVSRFCTKFLGNPAAGEDVAQDVFVEVWEARARYQPQRRFFMFLLTVARSRCLNHIRGDRRRAARAVEAAGPVEGPEPAAATPEQLDALLESERRRQVRVALRELPPLQREALLLRFDQGLSYPEIARVVGKSEEAIRSRVHHGLKLLRRQIAGGGEP
jgi:RNA polymerase sigma-70 factor (ECF subfamily)